MIRIVKSPLLIAAVLSAGALVSLVIYYGLINPYHPATGAAQPRPTASAPATSGACHGAKRHCGKRKRHHRHHHKAATRQAQAPRKRATSTPGAKKPTSTHKVQQQLLAPLGQVGPGDCVPGKSLLRRLRHEKYRHMNFRPPYHKTELSVLKFVWARWIHRHHHRPCVRTMARHVGGVKPSRLARWVRQASLRVTGLTAVNTYYLPTGRSVRWKVQTFPAHELIWFAPGAAGKAEFKFACGNILRAITLRHHGHPRAVHAQSWAKKRAP